MSRQGGPVATATSFLSLSLRHSKWLVTWYVFIYLCALAAVLLLDVPLWAQLTIALICGLVTLEGIRRQGMRTASAAIRRLDWHPDSRWHLFNARGDVIRAHRWRASINHRWLIVLQFWCGETGRQIPVLIPADAVGHETHRGLRVRLRADQPGR